MPLPTFSYHHPDQSATINTEARLSTSKKIITHWSFRRWLALLSNKALIFCIKVCTLHFKHNAIPHLTDQSIGLPRWRSGIDSACQCMSHRKHGFNSWVRKILWSRKWKPTLAFSPRKFHGWRSQAGYSPWSHKESDKSEWLSMHALLFLGSFFKMKV